MNLRKMTTKELERKRDRYRPEALSQTFFILALVSSAMLGEALTIIHEYIKENFLTAYNEWAWVAAFLGLVISVMVIVSAYAISVKDHNKIAVELNRRSEKKNKRPR